MKSDSMTIMIISSKAKGAISYYVKTAHIKLALAAMVAIAFIAVISTASAYLFHQKAETALVERNEALAGLEELSKHSIVLDSSRKELDDKLKNVEGKLMELQELLKKKGIKKELSLGGEFLPVSRLSLSYAESLNEDIDDLTAVLRKSPIGVPLDGKINSGYGRRRDPMNHRVAFHGGVDIDAVRGERVRTPADGVVRYAGWYRALGRAVIVKHKNGYRTTYGHLSKIMVKTGQKVQAGDVIGLAGSSGRSTGPHLHYEIAKDGKRVNPKKYMYLR